MRNVKRIHQMTLACEEQQSQVYDMVIESENNSDDEDINNKEKKVNDMEEEKDEKEEGEKEEEKGEKEKEEEKDEGEKEEGEKEEEKDKKEDDKDEESDNELLITPVKEKSKPKKPKLIVTGKVVLTPKKVVTKLPDVDEEKTDEEQSDMESESEINIRTGFPVYKSKSIKYGQLYMNKNKLVYVTKDNDTIKDVENVVSNTKLKKGCLVHVPGVEFDVYTGKPRGRPPKGKIWDDSNKEWVEKGKIKRKLDEDFDDEVKVKFVRF